MSAAPAEEQPSSMAPLPTPSGWAQANDTSPEVEWREQMTEHIVAFVVPPEMAASGTALIQARKASDDGNMALLLPLWRKAGAGVRDAGRRHASG